mgnify:CR=1 FL=1
MARNLGRFKVIYAYNKIVPAVIVILSILIFVSGLYANNNGSIRDIEITYIANSGFLIEVQDKKILIDALFGREELSFCEIPKPETINRIIQARDIFENIDLVLATHNHRDHFHAPFVSEFLQNNKQVAFLSTQQAVRDLKMCSNYEKLHNQIVDTTPEYLSSVHKTINGIELTIYRLRHSAYYEENPQTGQEFNRHENVQNLGFLLDINGIKIFHCGDSSPRWINEYQHFRIDRENIDIAFLDRAFIVKKGQGLDIIKKYINPQNIILMHIHPANTERYERIVKTTKIDMPPITIFKNQMESKTYK